MDSPSEHLCVLLVEDDDALAELIERGFVESGLRVDRRGDGVGALATLTAGGCDVCVLDARLPAMDGFDVLASVRSAGVATPIIMLTARDAVSDRVRGLELGADDYLVKPFALAELLARVRALTRRAGKRSPIFTCRDLALHALEHRVVRGGVAIELSPKQFLLLLALLRHGREVSSRSLLLRDVFGYSFDPGTNIVDVHVAQLRKRIDRPGEPSLIETVRGVGYRMAPETPP